MRKKSTLLENIPFIIDPVRVMREMKIPHAISSLAEIDEKPLADSIKRAIDRGYSLIHGKGVYQTYELSGVDGAVVKGPETGNLFRGSKMVKLLSGCRFATLMVATIGPDLENEVQELSDAGEISEAYVLEMVGGWMADYMAEKVDERIEMEVVKLGFERTMRFAPGYGDWDLENQTEVIRLADGNRIGVTVTKTNIMLPRKSVSAVIGWHESSN